MIWGFVLWCRFAGVMGGVWRRVVCIGVVNIGGAIVSFLVHRSEVEEGLSGRMPFEHFSTSHLILFYLLVMFNQIQYHYMERLFKIDSTNKAIYICILLNARLAS